MQSKGEIFYLQQEIMLAEGALEHWNQILVNLKMELEIAKAENEKQEK